MTGTEIRTVAVDYDKAGKLNVTGGKQGLRHTATGALGASRKLALSVVGSTVHNHVSCPALLPGSLGG